MAIDYVHWKETIENHRGDFLEAVRVYMGIALFLKGIVFVANTEALLSTMDAANVPAASMALAHYVALAHLGGGFLLWVGLVTRLAAAVQIPAVLGAILFVHRREGLFTPGATLELALLVLFVLTVLVISGGGRFSVDHYLAKHAGSNEVAQST